MSALKVSVHQAPSIYKCYEDRRYHLSMSIFSWMKEITLAHIQLIGLIIKHNSYIEYRKATHEAGIYYNSLLRFSYIFQPIEY